MFHRIRSDGYANQCLPQHPWVNGSSDGGVFSCCMTDHAKGQPSHRPATSIRISTFLSERTAGRQGRAYMHALPLFTGPPGDGSPPKRLPLTSLIKIVAV